MRKKSKKVSLENLGSHQLSEGVDAKGAEIIKLSDIEKSLPIEDQISPENIVEYTNIKGETFEVDKIKKEVGRPNSLMGWLLELPLSDVTNQHPDVERLVKENKELKEVIAKKELDQLKKDKSNCKGSKAVSIFRKNWCEPNFDAWFKEYYKANYKSGSMVDDCVVKEAYQASKAWENLQHDLEEEQSAYEEGILSHNSEMPSERTWIDIRTECYAKNKVPKQGRGRRPNK